MANGQEASFIAKVAVSLTIAAILSLGGGGVWVGSIATRVSQAEEELQKSDDDHDMIIRIDEAQKTIKTDVETIKNDQKIILDEIRKLGNRNAEGDTN